MSWPHGPPQVQSDGFGELATTLKQGKGHGQGNKSNERFPLYIVNIPLDVGEEQLIEMFSQAGEVTHAKCLPPKEGRNSCVGFITYGSKAEAEKAISKFHNAQIGNQTLRVDYTKSFKEGQTLRSGKPESSFSSESNQTGKAPFFCLNGLQQQQSSFGTNPQDNQASNVHSIGRGIHYDDHNAGNQLSSVGRGIHTKLAKTLMNGDNQTPFNQGTSQPGMKGDFSSGTINFHNPGLQETQLALNGPYVTSSTSMLGAPSVENYNYQNNQQDILSNADDSQVHPSLALEGDHFGSQVNEMVNGISGMHVSQHVDNQQFGTNQISGPNQPFGASQPFRENESFTTNQSYSSGNQPFGTSQSFCENQSFGSNQPYDQSQSSAAGQPFGTNQPLGTNQPFGSTNQSFGGSQSPSTNQTFGSASRSFSGNQIFGENQYQVSGRLPRSQTGSGDKTCRKCGEPGHFARECPNISAGGGGGGNRGNYHQRGQPGHFSRECPNGSNRGRGCDKSGEEGPFARECPKSNEDGRGIRPPPVNYVPPPLPDDVDLLFKAAVHKGINFDRFDNIPVEVTGNNPPPAIQTFDELLLPDMLKSNLGRAEFTKPTPVQKHGIPIILNGRDVMACAQTGSGKTVAFLLPVMAGMVNSRLPEASYLSGEAASPAALCIAPTRELAFQIYTEALKFSSGTYLRPVVCYGGVSVQHQLQKLERGCHILIGTPGRLIDFVGKNRVSLTNVRYLILDEADRMLDMGFENDIRKIVGQFGMPDKTQRQTLMFSATFPDEIQKMAGEFLNDYLFLAVGSVGGSNLDIKQHVLDVQGDQKRSSLVDILGQSGTDKTLVFVERKRNADFLASWLSQNQYPATSISGDRTQMEREDALRDFRNGRAPILIATSVAARGLDIPDVKHVVNYDLPQQIEDYVHRIGRTGRIGNQGRATAFFERGKDDKLARSLVKVLSDALQDVPSWLEETAERALGTSYGPAGGKFASRDTRQFGSRRSDGGSGGGGGKSGGGYMSGNNSNSEPPQTTNVSFTNQSSNIQSGDDEEEWD